MATLGVVLRSAREAKRTSLREAARSVGISPSYLSDLERDLRIPSEEVLAKLAALLSLDLENLIPLTGRLGGKAERYLRDHPLAGLLLRKIAAFDLHALDLTELLNFAAELARKRR